MKKILSIIFLMSIIFPYNEALAKSTHEKNEITGAAYICHFGKYGVVTIDTRDPGASITVHGVRHAATDGSYFYQTDDGKIAIAFNPEMTRWTLMSEDDSQGITDTHCKIKSNVK